MIYLAGPYSHESAEIREERFEALTKKAAELMLQGQVVFSPVTHGHTIAERHDLPLEFEWWRDQCFGTLRHSRLVLVLLLPGVKESKGVAAEIELAQSLGIPVEHVLP